jgi:coenzyme F420 hydrogenase subunit beta
MIKNISSIVKKGMCIGCGACFVSCKYNSIKMDYSGESNIPIINEKLCNSCGLCRKVCPALNFDKMVMKNSFLGYMKKIYIGHSKNYKIRYNSSSGGIATSIALFLLENRYIDGVVCTIESKKNPLNNETIITWNSKEVINAKGSKYYPTSPCIKLREILEQKGKFLFIGKGCDIEGLEKLKKILPVLREKIFLSVGIFCDHQPSRSAIAYLLKQNNISTSNVKKICYRGNGWPGYLSIFFKIGDQKRIPYNIAWTRFLANPKFVLPRCRLCFNGLAELSDISLGDPWALQDSLEPIGESLIVIRSKLGEKIIKEMYLKDFIEVKMTTKKVLVDSQRSIIAKKKKILIEIKMLNIIEKFVPILKERDLEKKWKIMKFFDKMICFVRLIIKTAIKEIYSLFYKSIIKK